MRKKLLLIVSLLVLAVLSVAAINNPNNQYSYNLTLNEEVTKAVSNSQWQEGSKQAFKKNEFSKQNSTMDIKLDVEPDPTRPNFAKVSAHGTIKIQGENYPFTAEGLVGQLKSNRGDYFHGSLDGEIKNINVKKNESNNNFVLGLDMLPSEDKIIVSANVGSLEEMGLLFFGDSFIDQELADLIQQQTVTTTN